MTIAIRSKVDTHNSAFWAWWVIACLMAIIIFYRIVNFIYRRSLLARRATILAARKEAHAHRKFRMRHMGPAMIAIVKRIFSVQTLPIYLYRSPSIGELVWTWGYVGVIIGFAVYFAQQFGPYYYSAFGYMVFAQLPLIIGLAGKNNIISYLTRISYERFHYMHRTAGRMAILFAWIHCLGHLRQGVRGKSRLIIAGGCALAAMTVIELTSERPVRKGLYEVFLVFHLLSVMMLIAGTWIHQPHLSYWIYSGLILWSLDRVVSIFRFIMINRLWRNTEQGTVELLANDVLRITVKGKWISWSPGQHAYVSCPSLGKNPIERHPFSIMNIQQPHTRKQEMIFLVRSHTGFTKRIKDGLQGTNQSATVLVEGPYGVPPTLTTYDTIILVAGGVGITHALGHFLGVLQDMRKKTTLTRRVRLIWATKHSSDVDWILPTLHEAFKEETPEDVRVELDIHLSQSSIAEDPHEDEVPDDMEDMDMPSSNPGAEETQVSSGATPEKSRMAHPAAHHHSRPPVRALLRRSLSNMLPALESPSLRHALQEQEKRVGLAPITEDPSPETIPLPETPAVQGGGQPLRPTASRQISGFTKIVIARGISSGGAAGGGNTIPESAEGSPDESQDSPSSSRGPSAGVSASTPASAPPQRRTLDSPASGTTTLVSPRSSPLGAPIKMPDSMSPFVKVHSVRASLDDLLMHDLNKTQGPVHVSVCGPSSLAEEVRKVVRHTIDPFAIMKGEQQSIDLRIEQFGW